MFPKPSLNGRPSNVLAILAKDSKDSIASSNGLLLKMKSFCALTLQAVLACVCVAVSASGQTPVFNTGQAAHLVIGQTNFTNGDFGASNTLLGSPSGIAYANGTLWVIDSNRL